MSTGLKAQILQTKPFESLEQEAFLNLVRTAATVEHAFEEGLRPYGLTPTQYNVLRILRGAGEGGLCRNDLTARMIKPVPDATRLLTRLEAAGYVERRRESDDKRYVTARITESGLKLLERVGRPVIELHEAHFDHMSETQLRQLIALLGSARAAVE